MSEGGSTYREVLQKAAGILTAAGIEDADWDAWLLLSHVTGMNRARYFMDQREPMPAEAQAAFDEMIRKRAERIPLQHLLGEAWFMGFPFYVNENVLIPRQDTEKLVELVLEAQRSAGIATTGRQTERMPENTVKAVDLEYSPENAEVPTGRGAAPGASLLDMCTGSGCIAISLERLGQWSSVTAADISEKALAVAAKNAERNRSQVKLVESDLFASFAGERFDVIVSNPPYIPTAQCEELMPEVRDHDPRLALDGREDGLYFYRKLAEECPEHLNPGGKIWWEIGWDQGAAVCGLLRQAGFRGVEVIKDDAGQDRVVTGEYYV